MTGFSKDVPESKLQENYQTDKRNAEKEDSNLPIYKVASTFFGRGKISLRLRRIWSPNGDESKPHLNENGTLTDIPKENIANGVVRVHINLPNVSPSDILPDPTMLGFPGRRSQRKIIKMIMTIAGDAIYILKGKEFTEVVKYHYNPTNCVPAFAEYGRKCALAYVDPHNDFKIIIREVKKRYWYYYGNFPLGRYETSLPNFVEKCQHDFLGFWPYSD
ncbi:unnamed protein product [Rodentolepis nana]|uniref:DUF4283 domain-containing protein n=1 Tax=Rodentolepis nana TaxID=102285 RepID=A0A0R3TJS8_RODNA|nr:unnamed protein product [Rodentolepis nana]